MLYNSETDLALCEEIFDTQPNLYFFYTAIDAGASSRLIELGGG